MVSCGIHKCTLSFMLFFLAPNENHAQKEVSLVLKHGVEAKNYDDVSDTVFFE